MCGCGVSSDNHDVVSLKLYQLTVLRSKKEEEEEEEEITIPSVDNLEQILSKQTQLKNYFLGKSAKCKQQFAALAS